MYAYCPLSGQSHNTFVQISLAQYTSWAETHLGGVLGLRLGGFSPPPSLGLATSLHADPMSSSYKYQPSLINPRDGIVL